MIDPNAKVLSLLEANGALVAITGSRIYAGRNIPPRGYTPNDGSAIAFRIRGGPGFDLENPILVPSFQFKCYGATELAAMTCYRALVDALHDGHSADVLRGIQESVGQLLEEPSTEWPFVLVFFTVHMRAV